LKMATDDNKAQRSKTLFDIVLTSHFRN
jgi:hypothetical protein